MTIHDFKVIIVDMSRLADLRTQAGFSQSALAARLGVDQGHLSRLESRENPLVGSLETYLAAIGGKLRLVAEINGEAIPLKLGR